MRYTWKDIQNQFPDDEACLQLIFDSRYGKNKTCPKCGLVGVKFYRIKTRMSFKCSVCRQQIYPLKDTIFEKTTTPLTDWIHVLYLLSVSKNGISALEIQRQVGVSYKTAHRMAMQIRLLMSEHGMLGKGGYPVEVDEMYVSGRVRTSEKQDMKVPVIAALENGPVKIVRHAVVPKVNAQVAGEFLDKNVKVGSILHTDEHKVYKHSSIKARYDHESVRHIGHEYVRNGVTTNHIENFFGQFKTSILGTHHSVSPYRLSSYVGEFAFRYNHRHESIFSLLMAKAVKRV